MAGPGTNRESENDSQQVISVDMGCLSEVEDRAPGVYSLPRIMKTNYRILLMKNRLPEVNCKRLYGVCEEKKRAKKQLTRVLSRYIVMIALPEDNFHCAILRSSLSFPAS
jgi:hypothetical protein